MGEQNRANGADPEVSGSRAASGNAYVWTSLDTTILYTVDCPQ